MRRFHLLCPSYSGSTMLSVLASWHPEVIGFGDTYPVLPDYSSYGCLCGAPLLRCPMRQAIQERMARCGYPGYDWMRWKAVPAEEEHDAFLLSIEAATGAAVYFDGSKSPDRLLLEPAPDGLVRLVKDPRDAVASYRRYFRGGADAYDVASMFWLGYWSQARVADREARPTCTLYYEDLVAEPAVVLNRLWRFMGVAEIGVPPEAETHVTGHVSILRFRKCGIENHGGKWKQELSAADIEAVHRAIEEFDTEHLAARYFGSA